MKLINSIPILASILPVALSSDVTMNAIVKAKANTVTDLSIRSQAAAEDVGFVYAFINDFNTRMADYTSYMQDNDMQLPQGLANYYYHLATEPEDLNLQSDIAATFPFTEFNTFITKFPWYSTLLSEGSVTTFYLPELFLTAATVDSLTNTQSSTTTSESSPSSSLYYPTSTIFESDHSISSALGSSKHNSSSTTISSKSTIETSYMTSNIQSSSASISKNSSTSSSQSVYTSHNGANQMHFVFPLVFGAFGALLL
ncbi:hypothetical protein Kpol_1041p23 [Vanderwaltozyma polyspora DSM 70294]|uniref:Uncharacterized protein n=1 Tax=Vanderwaltozyma polyspora (strain ATCC 22028 / DSM 70294 / BCRC 21397 / CBS 2163 / NBRC 10782 / NRRL Y-8283 / UCD 57-17) TaxID=436907 RepID=A7TL90_VANPO|nr:uncharacterized protein Kpol_1041p23 [Vanderwaltozyma polyspora DSM 70294]EDO16965.1 hypothetical protein Kpol_1041p23 [Vanderwaltozyma polyspora DSM 70294]